MLTMGKMYQTLKKYDCEMQMDKMEFFRYFIPREFKSLWLLEKKLEETVTYRSSFFNGNVQRRGLNECMNHIIKELCDASDEFMGKITEAAVSFFDFYGIHKKNAFQQCLAEWKTELESEPVLERYVAAREEEPNFYADILAALYLYTVLLWKKQSYLKFLSERDIHTVSEEWKFDLERVGLYADCGKETTIFRTDLVEKHGLNWLDIQVDFSPTQLRPQVPVWASVVFRMRPPRDISRFHTIQFRFFPVIDAQDEKNAGCGIEQLLIEVKPEARDQIRHYTYPVHLNKGPQVVRIPLKQINPRILKQFEELCFVVNFNDLNAEKMRGHFQIAEVSLS